MFLNDDHFEQFHGYEKFDPPIKLENFDVIGCFEYATASIMQGTSSTRDTPCIPRSVFKELEEKISQFHNTDNKTVFICKDKMHFGTTDWAINFKDFYVRIGTWNQVVGYGSNELKLKSEKISY